MGGSFRTECEILFRFNPFATNIMALGSQKLSARFEPDSSVVLILKNTQICRCKLVSSVTRFGDLLNFGKFLKPFATIDLPKSPTF